MDNSNKPPVAEASLKIASTHTPTEILPINDWFQYIHNHYNHGHNYQRLQSAKKSISKSFTPQILRGRVAEK